MPDRDGSLSSFPTSLDQFVIKQKYNPDVALSQQNVSSLEQANHFNHMFDALFNIENHILSGSGGCGYPVVTRWSDGINGENGPNTDVYQPNLLMGYDTISIPMTGNTISATAMIPSAFGETPFDKLGFAVGHNLYVTNPKGAANTEGIWANKSWGNAGPFNNMMKWFQFFTFVKPISGRLIEITVKNLPYHSTSDSITSIFTDNMTLSRNLEWEDFHDRNGWDGDGYGGIWAATSNVPGITYWALQCEANNDSRYGWAWPTKIGSVEDSYVEWGEISDLLGTPETSNEVYTRGGPMVRASGTMTNASFYCVSIGDVPFTAGGLTGDIGKHARIIKMVGANLTNEGPATPDGGGESWPAGTLSYVGTGIAYTTSSSGHYWFGELATRYRLKCETVPGSAKITVESSLSPYSSWSTLYGPFYDGQNPLTEGYSGFFSQAMNGDDWRYVKFLGNVKVENLSSDTTIYTTVQLMYALATPEANFTMEAGI